MKTYIKKPNYAPEEFELESTEGLTETSVSGFRAYMTHNCDGENCLANIMYNGTPSCETFYFPVEDMTEEEIDRMIEALDPLALLAVPVECLYGGVSQ